MEIEKPVLQQPTTGLLKCYPNLSFSPSLPVLHHHQDANETKTTKKISGDVKDDGDGVDSGNDNGNNNDSSKRSRILLKEAKGDREDSDDRNRSSIAFKQTITNYDVQQEHIIAAVPDLDCPEFPSFKNRFSPLPAEILGRDHDFVAFKWQQNLSDNDASPNTMQEETLEAEKRDSLNPQEKTKHLTSSSYSSIIQHHHHRRSVTLATMPPSILQSSEILDLIPSFNGSNSEMRDKDTNTLSSQDKTPDEKRPRIERPRARYPNSTRRTSAPACLWSAPSLLPDQHSKSASSTLHDNLVLLHKLLAKHRTIPENVTTLNFDPSAANDNIAAVLLPETSSATIAPHFQATQAAAPQPSLTTWQWLRGRRKNGIMA